MASLRWLVVTIFVSLCSCEAYKVLVVIPFPSKSHSILGSGHVRLLLEARHEVTYVTPFPIKEPHRNLHQIDVRSNLELVDSNNMFNVKNDLNNELNLNSSISTFTMVHEVGRRTLENADMQKLINDQTINFDVIIVEWMFSGVLSGLSTVFGCPYIWWSTVEPHWMTLKLIDESPNPAYTPDISSDKAPPFPFKERVIQLTMQIIGRLVEKFIIKPKESQLYEETFAPILAKKGQALPSLESVVRNASLMLGNSHVSLGQAIGLPQNYKSIGGYHIDPKVKPLPENLKKIMDNAKNGVIYFSMGSTLKSKDLPEKLKRSLLEMFGKLKYTVFWKFEEVLPDLPKNVHILDWAPQQSILAHPNCVLFITHGGLLSIIETVHFGVAIIGIPIFGDQFLNIDRAEQKGFAKRVDLSYTMANELKVVIEEILGSTKYAEKVKELSLIYHDRPVPPGKELVHWVEHVVRTRGALHLRSPALLMPWYQKAYLDLAALIFVVIIVLKIVIKRSLCDQNNIYYKKKNI